MRATHRLFNVDGHYKVALRYTAGMPLVSAPCIRSLGRLAFAAILAAAICAAPMLLGAAILLPSAPILLPAAAILAAASLAAPITLPAAPVLLLAAAILAAPISLPAAPILLLAAAILAAPILGALILLTGRILRFLCTA